MLKTRVATLYLHVLPSSFRAGPIGSSMYNVSTYISIDAQALTVELIEPHPASQQFPCPNQRVIYKCSVLVESFSITWVLPNNDDATLSLGGTQPIGTTSNTTNGQFIAALNGSERVGTLNSTLLIEPPLDDFNNSVLTCRGSSATDVNPTNMNTITLSGE